MDYEKLYLEEKEKNKYLEEKNKYLEDIIFIYKNNKNIGERDEILLYIKLLNKNIGNNNDIITKLFGKGIHNIKILKPYKKKEILDIEDFKEITNLKEIKKTSYLYKADFIIQINKTKEIHHISMKSFNGNSPSILNHTRRSAKVFRKGGILHRYLPTLDKIINVYILERNMDNIPDDIKLFKLLNIIKNKYPTIKINKYNIIEVLIYFIFKGTGNRRSNCEADSIIEYKNNIDNINFIICKTEKQKKKYILNNMNNFVISLRNKNKNKKYNSYDWLYNKNNKIKGDLHIRLKK